MQYSFLSSCLLALTAVSSVVAQTAGFDAFSAPSTPGSTIKAGAVYTIKWTPSAPAGKISIVLLEGSSNITLQVGPTIASGIDSVSGSYDWNVPDNGTVFPVYGLKIQLDSDPTIFQYSTYFSISGLKASGASTSAAATVTVQVSSVSGAVVTTTLSAQTTTMNGTSATGSSTSSGFSNATVTTTLSTSATGIAVTGSNTGTSTGTSTGTATGSSASATKSTGAASSVVIGGTSLLGALMVSLGMLL